MSSFLKFGNHIASRFIPKVWIKKWQMHDSSWYQIIKHPSEVFNIEYHIKDATWESMTMPEVWRMSKSYTFTMYHEKQDILRIDNAQISSDSDIVKTENGVVWDKYESRMYNYMYAMDANLMANNQELVLIRNPKSIHHIPGNCLSLLGVYGNVWAHFIAQFLPKLYYSQKAGLLDKEITVVLPEYDDKNIKELVNNVLSKHSTCKIFVVPAHQNKRCIYQCETLFWIPTAAAMSNDTKIPILYQNILPNQMVDLWYNEIFESYKSGCNEEAFEKIYLVRRGALRNVSNIDEVETFFRGKGFMFIEPHKYSIAQKIAIFRKAKIIAGPHSSAWSNVMFCMNAKGIMLTPISWLFDAYVGYSIRENACQLLVVAGDEIEYKHSHNPYHIDMNELCEAYSHVTNGM